MTRVSSTNLTHRKGGGGEDWGALASNSSMNRLAMRGLMGEPMAEP